MTIKQTAALEVQKDGRVYTLLLPSGANLGEIHDVLFDMRTEIIAKIGENLIQETQQKPECASCQ